VGGSAEKALRAGLLYGLAAYILWGLVPLYFKSVGKVPPSEILAQRIVWSALLLLALLATTGRLSSLAAAFCSRRALGMLALSTLFIATNWYVFIYSVVTNQILRGSLGYFILPIVNVAIGTVFFHERMRPLQWVALACAAAGVCVLIVWLGLLPWIALTLALTFSVYGVIRKHAPVEGTVGLAVETLLLAPLALGFLLIWNDQGRLVFGQSGWEIDTLIILSGLVTTVPLIFFAQAVRRLRIVTIGFMQYISPSLAFLIAVFFYGEPFSREYQAGYSLIWCGLAVFVWDALRASKPRDETGEQVREEEKIQELEIMN
jgi:chloramphenicol-sensitive protein RarD